MAYLAQVDGRALRLDVVRGRDGALTVEVAEQAGAAADHGAAAPGGGRDRPSRGAAGKAAREPDRLAGRRTCRLEVRASGGWLAARLDDGRSLDVLVERRGGGAVVWLDGAWYRVDLTDERAVRRARGPAGGGGGPQTLTAPMPGKIVKHLVAPGDRVEAGQGVVVVEAMKMENELCAPAAGVVKALPAAEGTAVEAGAPLMVLE